LVKPLSEATKRVEWELMAWTEEQERPLKKLREHPQLPVFGACQM
jgi:hypothetical protein